MIKSVEEHYGNEGIVDRIVQALGDAGFDTNNLDADVLAGADEFHIGGREGTLHVASAVDLGPGKRLLDVGCGIGGAARFLARSTGASVTGVDLTPEFVEAAIELTDLVGMSGLVDFKVGSATDLPFLDDAFDAVTMLHVGMNIEDKNQMMRELTRVCRPQGTVVVYDVTITKAGDLPYPMPWSSTPQFSFPEPAVIYEEAAASAGLEHLSSSDHYDLALKFFNEPPASPPPVSLGHLMGPRMLEMRDNAGEALNQGLISPVLMTFQVP
ncbi:MAG: methyltransferase domain-containing protein [Actinomycetota bacterium]|nr:methyltransferase domain-containing protein [Actinomycetota bacterium]MEC9058472.1 methyltransferase domain-containing protein [Actinomycetota bacterium]MED5361859.1 methyltransferase domain-containing protein [Actinomycetota bacterium]